MSSATISLPSELKSRAASAAKRAGVSTAQFVRDAVEVKLAANGASAPRPSLYDLTRDLCGSVTGGPRDLSEKKKHLAGYGK